MKFGSKNAFRILSLLMAVIMIFGMIPFSAFAAETEAQTVSITASTSGATASAAIGVDETLIIKLTNGSNYNTKTYSITVADDSVAEVTSGDEIEISSKATGEITVKGLADGVTTITMEAASGNSSSNPYTATITLTVGSGESEGGSDGNEDSTTNSTVEDNPDTLYVAFTSDVHNGGSATSSGTAAYRLNSWLDNVSAKIGDVFDTMGFCGDNGSAYASGDTFWNYVQIVMDVVTASDKVKGDGIFIAGNHEYYNGNFGSTTNTTAEAFHNIGYSVIEDDYLIYTFGSASDTQSFTESNINALETWLSTNATGDNAAKPVFVMSHYPIHYYSSQSTTNASALVEVLNNYPNVIFLWGHNHTMADTHYDQVYKAGSELSLTSSSSSKVTINFTYTAAGCMSDSEYSSSGSGKIAGKGLVAKIDGSNVTLTYYAADSTVISTETVDVTENGSGDSGDSEGGSTPDGGDDDTETPENGYIKVTAPTESGEYVIVANGYALDRSETKSETTSSVTYSGFSGTAVTVSDDAITSAVTESMIWTVTVTEDGYYISSGDQYLTADYSRTSGDMYSKLSLEDDSTDTWTYTSDGYLTTADNDGACYLYYYKASSVYQFTVRSSGQDVTFYKVAKTDADCDHTYDEGKITTEPTCTNAGVKTFTCGNCDNTYTKEVEATGHNYERVVTAPTCTEKGYTKHTCAACGDSYVDTYVDETGHSFDEGVVTKEPTTGATGVITYTCLTCGEQYSDILERLPGFIPFEDVAETAYYYDAVTWAVENGITTGTSETTFSPDDDCTRAQVVAFLWRAAGEPEPEGKTCPFTDVDESVYYYKAVLWAVENGITTGTTATTFSPADSCSRAQIVTFLWRFAGEPKPSSDEMVFTDVNPEQDWVYYGDAVLWAVENGVTLGMGNNLFAPGDVCLRCQVVTFLYRYFTNNP